MTSVCDILCISFSNLLKTKSAQWDGIYWIFDWFIFKFQTIEDCDRSKAQCALLVWKKKSQSNLPIAIIYGRTTYNFINDEIWRNDDLIVVIVLNEIRVHWNEWRKMHLISVKAHQVHSIRIMASFNHAKLKQERWKQICNIENGNWSNLMMHQQLQQAQEKKQQQQQQWQQHYTERQKKLK